MRNKFGVVFMGALCLSFWVAPSWCMTNNHDVQPGPIVLKQSSNPGFITRDFMVARSTANIKRGWGLGKDFANGRIRAWDSYEEFLIETRGQAERLEQKLRVLNKDPLEYVKEYLPRSLYDPKTRSFQYPGSRCFTEVPEGLIEGNCDTSVDELRKELKSSLAELNQRKRTEKANDRIIVRILIAETRGTVYQGTFAEFMQFSIPKSFSYPYTALDRFDFTKINSIDLQDSTAGTLRVRVQTDGEIRYHDGKGSILVPALLGHSNFKNAQRTISKAVKIPPFGNK